MRRLFAILSALCMLLCSAALGEETVLAPMHPVPEYVTWLLDAARNELGYKELPDGSTKYGAWAGDPQAQWCAEFLCWCVDQVDQQHDTDLLTRVFPKYSGMNIGRDWFLREGRYIARTGYVNGWGSQWYTGEEERLPANSYIPQPGDWVFFSVDGENTSHVALVEYCAIDEHGNVTVYALEGNMPDRVQRTGYKLTEERILGYGTVYDLADIVLTGGCKGAKVLALQKQLVYLHYLDPQYMTGEYGPSTAQAVRQFQQDTGKVPTGIANHHTQLTLSELYHDTYWKNDDNFRVSEQ